jgi:ABC-type glutathione transport system ATPase component
MLSEQYRPQVKAMLERISEEMGVQILMITHAPELVCGQVIDIE